MTTFFYKPNCLTGSPKHIKISEASRAPATEGRNVCSPHFNYSTMKERVKLVFKANILEA